MRSELLILVLLLHRVSGEDFYELLGVSRDANERTIRKAFKKLALQKHPDKHPEDKDAHAAFVRINRAYEVLKDEQLRKKYDQVGEEGLDNNQAGNNYQSWQFYNDNFGIYDEDVEIVTLSRTDFERVVIESGHIWFVNFYSTFCSHCHDLAPTWRKFAREMDGVLRIGAVNCAEDPMLCQSQQVMGYPSLVLYPSGQFFYGSRDLDSLIEFTMRHLSMEVHIITMDNVLYLSREWQQYAKLPWIVDFCDDHDICLSTVNRRKLAAMLKGVMNVGNVHCFDGAEKDPLCDQLKRTQGVAFYPAGLIEHEHEKELSSLDAKDLMNSAIQLLPDLPILSEDQVESLGNVQSMSPLPTLAYFLPSLTGEMDAELKKLPFLLEGVVTVGVVDCSRLSTLCAKLNLKLPTMLLFKENGYEINYGKYDLDEVLAFVRESVNSPLITLDAVAYEAAMNSGDAWLIDYFAPWCPPCLRLLPELRKLHRFLEPMVNIGTIDCTIHTAICQRVHVSSYPNTIFHHDGKSHQSVGYHDIGHIVEFITDARNPSVVELSPEDLKEQVLNRETGHIWLVDFFAPWCGPCQQLAPEFRKLARSVKQLTNVVFFGSVDCQTHGALCSNMHISTYPTVRLFPADQLNHMDYPSNWWRDHGSMQRWLQDFLPSKVSRLGNDFYDRVVSDSEPWLVDFYAPWCGHCVQFAPVFEHIAEVLDGRVHLAKVNCDEWPGVCHSAGVNAYPTLRLYNGSGRSVQGQHIQSQSWETIVQIVEAELDRSRRLVRDEF